MKTVLFIVGPTAVGKTAIGVDLALTFGGEVISGDSMQVYKGLDIGTAKVTSEERKGVPHHLIDTLSPGEAFSASSFQREAFQLIDQLFLNERLPIVVGGTGLYIKGLTKNLSFHDTDPDEGLRAELEDILAAEGPAALHQRLKQQDPKSAESIHWNNGKKLIRAIEIVETTGSTLTEFGADVEEEPSYQTLLIGLTMERSKLYERINLRVDQMVEQGLVEEARQLYTSRLEQSQAAKAIGYKEFFPYFAGEQSLDDAILQLKQNSRRFAKRQLTWFRNKENVEWFDRTNDTYENTLQKITDYVKGNSKESSNINI